MPESGCCGCSSTYPDSSYVSIPMGTFDFSKTFRLTFEMENGVQPFAVQLDRSCHRQCTAVADAKAADAEAAAAAAIDEKNTRSHFGDENKRKMNTPANQISQRINRQNNFIVAFILKHQIVHDNTQSTSRRGSQPAAVSIRIRERKAKILSMRFNCVCSLPSPSPSPTSPPSPKKSALIHPAKRSVHSSGDQTTTAITNNCRLEKRTIQSTNGMPGSTWMCTSEIALRELKN